MEKDNPPLVIQEGGQGHRSSLLSVKVIYFVYFTAFSIYVTYVNIYFLSIGLSGIEIGLINTISPLMSMLGSPIWGVLSDRFGNVRRILSIAVCGAVGVTIGFAFTQNFTLILLLAGGYSLFTSSITPLLDSSTLLLLGNQRERYGRIRIWGSIGFIISAFISGQIFDQVGLEVMFFAIAGLLAISLLVLLWFQGDRGTTTRPEFSGIRQLVSHPEWAGFMVGLLIMGVANSGMHTFIGILIKEIGGGEGLVGLSASVGVLSELPVMFFSPRLIKRYHPRILLGFSFILYTLRLFLYGIIPSTSWVIPLSLLHGVSFGLYWVSSVAYANRIAPDNLKGTTQGVLIAIISLSSMLGGLLSGWIFDFLGVSTLFRIYSLFGIVALYILWKRPKTARNHG
jgi:MFS family permease